MRIYSRGFCRWRAQENKERARRYYEQNKDRRRAYYLARRDAQLRCADGGQAADRDTTSRAGGEAVPGAGA